MNFDCTRQALATTYLHPGPDPVRRVHDALGGLADAGGVGWDVLWAHGFAGQGLVRRRDTALITPFAGTEGLPIVGEWDSDVADVARHRFGAMPGKEVCRR